MRLSQRVGLVVLAIVLAAGCTASRPRPPVVPNHPPAAEIPVANLPEVLREWNWLSKNQEGSCVHASSVYHFRWHGRYDLAKAWRAKFSGGETATTIQRKWAAAGIPFCKTEEGEPAFLQWATKERHGAIIWFFPSHCVHFCGLATVDGRAYAILCDNNRVEKYLRVPYEEFVKRWREYGGFAMACLWSPAPPLAWPAYRPLPSRPVSPLLF
jgi:hypothetical protein